MKLTGKKITIVIIFLLSVIALVLLFFLIFNNEPNISTTERSDEDAVTTAERQLGADNITVLPEQQFPSDNTVTDIDDQGPRDDRVFFIPDEEERAENEPESAPRLVRLFAGPTAGYRIDKNDDGRWVVRVVEGGRGDRYRIQTFPYSLNFVSPGEFVRVRESHIFSNGKTLMLYENPEDETVIKSAFVSFTPSESDNIQMFENNIRVATNNTNHLFFVRLFNDKTVGMVINVANPEETKVIWESDFTNWLPQWGRNEYITLATPISDLTKGHVYLLDPKDEIPINKLVNVPSGGSAFVDTSSGYFVLYRANKRELVGSTVITEQSREKVVKMPMTLPEKCDGFNGIFVCAVPNTVPARTRSGYETHFPDSWYQGDITLNDSIILIDAVTGEKKLLMAPDQSDIQRLSNNRTFDVVNPRISEDGAFFFFVNKTDRSLWMLKI